MYLICFSTGHRICLERGMDLNKREWDTDEWQNAFYFKAFCFKLDKATLV